MGRNEIRLRRQMMSSGRIAQHRNYSDIMARHERDVKMKRVFRIFVYFLVVLFMVMLYFLVRSLQEKSTRQKQKPQTEATSDIYPAANGCSLPSELLS